MPLILVLVIYSAGNDKTKIRVCIMESFDGEQVYLCPITMLASGQTG